jgi:hypothetical protein
MVVDGNFDFKLRRVLGGHTEDVRFRFFAVNGVD